MALRVSARSHCGAERIYNLAEQLQTWIVHIDERFSMGPCKFFTCIFNSFTWRCASARSRCGAERIYNLVERLQTGIVRIDVRFSVDPCKLCRCTFQPFHVELRVGDPAVVWSAFTT